MLPRSLRPLRSLLNTLRFYSSVIPSDGSAINTNLFDPTDEHKMLRETVKSFVTEKVEPQAFQFNNSEKFNLVLFKELGQLGLFGITVDPEYGGSGMNSVAAIIAHEELAYSDPAFSLSYFGQSIMFANFIDKSDLPASEKSFLSEICFGEKIGAVVRAKPIHSRDLGTATKIRKTDLFSKISGHELWCINAVTDPNNISENLADYFLVTGCYSTNYASAYCLDNAFLSINRCLRDKVGMRATMFAEVAIKRPVNQELKINQTEFRKSLSLERLCLAAIATGISRRCVEVMNSYGRERKAFGRSINEFGQIQKHIADSYADYMAGKTILYQLAQNIDQHPLDYETVSVKNYCFQAALRNADRAIQTLGGNGYVGEYTVERLWRDAKFLELIYPDIFLIEDPTAPEAQRRS